MIGTVEHEAELGGSSRLDVRFRSPHGNFIADVRTVSDDAYDSENPVHEFSNELSKIAEELRREGIQGGFDYHVNGISGSVWEKRYKTKLTLPRSHEFKRVIFNEEFKGFVAAVRQEPNKRHTFAIDKQEASLSVEFNPRAGGFQSGSYLACAVAHDPVHNLVWRALEDKSDQIKRAGPRHSGQLAGVILCDGGCGMLRALRSAHTLAVDDVISKFLKKSKTVDFVCVVDVRESTAYGGTPPLRLEARTWSIRAKAWAQAFSASVNNALQSLGPPLDSAVNTLNHFKYAGDRQHLCGRHKRSTTMTHNSLEFSLRAVMDYLAGRIDRTEFERTVHPDWLGHLKQRLDQGRSIENVSIEPGPAEDDEGLLITFGEHDPARSPFRVPKKG